MLMLLSGPGRMATATHGRHGDQQLPRRLESLAQMLGDTSALFGGFSRGLCPTNPFTNREPPRLGVRHLPRPIESVPDLAVIGRAIAQAPPPYH